MRKIYLHCCFVLFCCLLAGNLPARTKIVIKEQSDLSELQGRVLQLIQEGEQKISVTFKPGYYIFTDNFLYLSQIDAPDLELIINGKGVCLIPEGTTYSAGDIYQGTFTTNHSWFNGEQEVPIWSDVHTANGMVEVVEEETKLCRLKSKTKIPENKDVNHSFILIPKWYKSGVYKIDRIEGQYIYFIAGDLKKTSSGGYNINNDYNYAKKDIRYKVCNLESKDNILRIADGKVVLPRGMNSIREGKADRFLTIENCSLKSFEISGLNVYGNSNCNYLPLITIKEVLSKRSSIHDCTFNGIKSDVIAIYSSPNVEIKNSQFINCYNNGIISDNESDNTTISCNSFSMTGLRMQNSFCISCQGSNFIINNNNLIDFGYGGIASGVWYGSEQKRPCIGVIENNKIVCTDSYVSNILNYGIMDGGAIYLYTKSDGITIRGNFIHNISGAGDNRGIFCDDGARNFTIAGNVITNVVNSYCIDSRRVSSIENKIGPTNVNNVISDNIVDGEVRFEGHESGKNGCEYGNNYIIKNDDNPSLTNEINNVSIKGESHYLKQKGRTKGKIIILRESYRLLKKSLGWKDIKQYVSK